MPKQDKKIILPMWLDEDKLIKYGSYQRSSDERRKVERVWVGLDKNESNIIIMDAQAHQGWIFRDLKEGYVKVKSFNLNGSEMM